MHVTYREIGEDDLPAFLDQRVFVFADVIGDGNVTKLLVLDNAAFEVYNPHAPRQWAPMGDARATKAKEASPLFNLYCENKSWPVQVVSTGKFPKNLVLHETWEIFTKFHDFDDFPVERTFSGGDVTYVVVKDLATKNEIVNNAMSGGVPINKRPDLMEQNGVKRPKTGSITAAAWATFDHMLATNGDFKEVFEKLKTGGMNPSTIRTQFAHWRKFNGIQK